MHGRGRPAAEWRRGVLSVPSLVRHVMDSLKDCRIAARRGWYLVSGAKAP